MKPALFALVAVIAIALITPSGHATSRSLSFNVRVEDRDVGTHVVRLDQRDGFQEAQTRVDLKVKLLFLTLFNYQHEATEHWKDGCLVKLETTTRSNRERFSVSGRLEANPSDRPDFLVSASRPDNDAVLERVTGCAATFAYWDLQRLQNPRLINTQSGEPVATALESLPPSAVPGTMHIAQTWVLRSELADIRLWYAPDGEWLGLQTTRDGNLITYVNETLL